MHRARDRAEAGAPVRLVRIPVARVALREDLGNARCELALLARLDMAGDPLGRGGALRGGGVQLRQSCRHGVVLSGAPATAR